MYKSILVLVGFSVCAAAEGPELRLLNAGEKLAAMATRDMVRQTRFVNRGASIGRPMTTIFSGDVVIPQVVDGAGWQTSMTFVNLRSTTNRFEVWLFTDSGGDMFIDVPGLGRTDVVGITLPPNTSATIETSGTAASLNQGWVYLYSSDVSIEIGSLSVFRQRVAGRPDFEAAVPTVSEFDDRFLLAYDNAQGFVTAAAIANPDMSPITVEATVRDERDNVLARETISIGKLSKVVFTLPSRWPATAGKRGIVEFRASGYGASAIGLRFNPGGAFTTFQTLTNVKWMQQSTTQSVLDQRGN